MQQGMGIVRHCVLIVAGLIALAGPTPAVAQNDIPPPIVKTLADPEIPDTYSPWLGAVAGATVATIGVNMWTGGALLAPAIGPAFSGMLGGAWLGTAAMLPLASQSLFQTTTLIATGIAGCSIGYWMLSD